jgi:hypothetical protein
MTRMSDHTPATHAQTPCNHVELPARSLLARAVHSNQQIVRHGFLFSAVLGLGGLGGCVPSLSVDHQDAGINSPPAILAVRSDQQELPQPGPVLFERGPGMVNVTLIDTDIEDTLFVRIFVDYSVSVPTPARSLCAGASGTANRTATCDIKALCFPSDVGVERLMTIHVFDRPLLDSGTPMFQAMDAPGLSTNRTYKLKCVEPSI